MPTPYETIRDEIQSQIAAVTDVKLVYPYMRYSADEGTFLNLFVKTAGDPINFVMFDRVANPEERENIGSAATDESDLLLITETQEIWDIYFFYGFRDMEPPDIGTPAEDYPSSILFNKIVEQIEDRFRFLQNLNGKVFKSHPLKTLDLAIVRIGDYLCHRAQFRLTIARRITGS